MSERSGRQRRIAADWVEGGCPFFAAEGCGTDNVALDQCDVLKPIRCHACGVEKPCCERGSSGPDRQIVEAGKAQRSRLSHRKVAYMMPIYMIHSREGCVKGKTPPRSFCVFFPTGPRARN